MKKIIFTILICFISFFIYSCSKDDEYENVLENEQYCAISYIENIIISSNFNYVDVEYNHYNDRSTKWNQLDFYLTDYNNYVFNSNNSYYIELIKNKLSHDFNLEFRYDGSRFVQVLIGTGPSKYYYHIFRYMLYNDDIVVFASPEDKTKFIHIRVLCKDINKHNHFINKLNN